MPSRGLIATFALAIGMAVAVLTPAVAVADDGSPTTWSVRPATEHGPDGRPWIELDVDPGSVITEHMTVTNHGDRDVDFRLSAADGYFTDSGHFNILPSDRESRDAGTWISIPDSVHVAAKASSTVAFTVAVPENATPGDHLAGVAASVVSTSDGEVGVESRVGFRVLSRVSGELSPALDADVSASHEASFNPFQPGTTWVDYAFTNSGNTRLSATTTLTISGPLGVLARTVEGESVAEMAPGETRTFRVEVPRMWALGFASVQLSVQPDPVPADAGMEPMSAVDRSVTFAAIPWSQIILAVAAALLIWWWLRTSRRRRADFERRLADAREQGRAQAERDTSVLARVGAACMLALAMLLVPIPAMALNPDPQGVEIDVVISALPTPPEPGPPGLPSTGSEVGVAPILAGIVLLGAGTTLVVHRRRGRVAS